MNTFIDNAQWREQSRRLVALGTELASGDPSRQATARQLLRGPWSAPDRTSEGLAKLDGPMVSIVLPTRNREALIGKAIDSVFRQTYSHWELLVIDDGSNDGTELIVETIAKHEPRLRYFKIKASGLCYARNVGLLAAQGEMVAYLDSDNTWLAHHLETAVRVLNNNQDVMMVYTAAIAFDDHGVFTKLIFSEYDPDRIKYQNFIDLNMVVHRKSIINHGILFDTRFTRLVDWDFLLQITRRFTAQPIPRITVEYGDGTFSRVSNKESFCHGVYAVISKHNLSMCAGIRILYILQHYLQLDESYIHTELRLARFLGFELAVWCKVGPQPPYHTDVLLYQGDLAETIKAWAPDLLHLHWLNFAESYLPTLAQFELPVTLREHGFEFDSRLLTRLLEQKSVATVFLHPYRQEVLPQTMPKLKFISPGFNPSLYGPGQHKEKDLVVRIVSGLLTKDVEMLFDVAALCPNHRFVLAIGKCNQQKNIIEYLCQTAQNRAEIRINQSHRECAALFARAAICLHTYPTDAPYRMPTSIAEAMASGCFILFRHRPEALNYVGLVGGSYHSVAEAADLIRATQDWSEPQWQTIRTKAMDRAFALFADEVALAPIFQTWIEQVTRHRTMLRQKLRGVRIDRTMV